MKIYTLVVHNSDEVKHVFLGDTVTIMELLRASIYWDDIIRRLDDTYYEDGQLITIDHVLELYHDGDSEDGCTLITPITENTKT